MHLLGLWEGLTIYGFPFFTDSFSSYMADFWRPGFCVLLLNESLVCINHYNTVGNSRRLVDRLTRRKDGSSCIKPHYTDCFILSTQGTWFSDDSMAVCMLLPKGFFIHFTGGQTPPKQTIAASAATLLGYQE